MRPKRKHKLRWQRKQATTWHTPNTQNNAQARYLSGLNSLQILQDHAANYLAHYLCFGPWSFAGDSWASTLVWYRPKGYTGYKTLTLFGTWVVNDEDAMQVIIGKKPLVFAAVHFNPESYFAVIRRDFTPYYGDKGSPPTEQSDILWQQNVQDVDRLTMRQQVADQLIEQLQHLEQDAPTS